MDAGRGVDGIEPVPWDESGVLLVKSLRIRKTLLYEGVWIVRCHEVDCEERTACFDIVAIWFQCHVQEQTNELFLEFVECCIE